MFTRLVVLFIATSLHKSAGLEGITQFSFAEAPPVEVKPEVSQALPEATVEAQPNANEELPKAKGENGEGIPEPEEARKIANEEANPIVPPAPVMKKDEEIRGLKNPFTSNPQLTDADERLQDFSKQLKEASTQMSGLYDTLVAQMDLYKQVLGTMVHNSRTLMSNMKVMLHEEGTALEMKNQARMKPVLGLDALIKEHHEILEVAGVGEEEGPKVEVKPKVHEESTVEVQPTAHEESPKATVEVQPKETNEEPPKTVEVQPQANGFFKGEVQPTVHEESPKATVEVKPNA
jgi:hypothetical protein